MFTTFAVAATLAALTPPPDAPPEPTPLPANVEVTLSGGPQLDYFPGLYVTMGAGGGITAVRNHWVAFQVYVARAEVGSDHLAVYNGRALLGVNLRLVGEDQVRSGLSVDLRALAGAMLTIQPGNVGTIPGSAFAGELASTYWFKPNFGLTGSLLCSFDMLGLVYPRPVLTASVGVTF